MPPDHPYPAAMDDAMAVWKAAIKLQALPNMAHHLPATSSPRILPPAASSGYAHRWVSLRSTQRATGLLSRRPDFLGRGTAGRRDNLIAGPVCSYGDASPSPVVPQSALSLRDRGRWPIPQSRAASRYAVAARMMFGSSS